MKKIGYLFILCFFFFSGIVNAQEITTYERTEENRYGVPNDISLTENVIYHAKQIPYVDSDVLVYDFASLFTDNEVEQLKTEAKRLSEKENYGVVIVTSSDLGSLFPTEYADSFYDYNKFPHDGILLLISMNPREVVISTSFNGQLLFDDYRIDDILDSVTPHLSMGNYYLGASTFLNEADYIFNEGISTEMDNCKIVNDMGDFTCYKEVPLFAIISISTVVSLFVTWLVTKRYRKIALATDANTYLKRGDVKLGTKVDRFVDSHTSRVYVSSSSSSSSHGGGSHRSSSSHHSSSGRSHGGGSRRF